MWRCWVGKLVVLAGWSRWQIREGIKVNNYKATKEEIITAIGVIAECLAPTSATRETCNLLRELYDELDNETEEAN